MFFVCLAKGVAQVNLRKSKMKARMQVRTGFCAINFSFSENEGAFFISCLRRDCNRAYFILRCSFSPSSHHLSASFDFHCQDQLLQGGILLMVKARYFGDAVQAVAHRVLVLIHLQRSPLDAAVTVDKI